MYNTFQTQQIHVSSNSQLPGDLAAKLKDFVEASVPHDVHVSLTCEEEAPASAGCVKGGNRVLPRQQKEKPVTHVRPPVRHVLRPQHKKPKSELITK